MGVLTGENGKIDGIPCLRHFRIVDSATPATGYCSTSKNGPFAIAGNTDWRGMANAYGAVPAKTPGSTFEFGCTDGTTGYTTAAGGAIVDRVKVHWDVEAGDLLYHEIYFSGVLALTAGANTETDTSVPAPASAIGLQCNFGGSDFDIRKAVLDIACLNPDYNDSSTGGVTARLAGNYAASFEMLGFFSSYSALPTKNSVQTFTIDATDTDTWDINYMIINDVSTDVVLADEQGRAVPNACSIKATWTGWSSAATAVRGYIIDPAETKIWGAA